MYFESASSGTVMLCPSCCTLDDIPEWDIADLKIEARCHRCGFSFPVLPGGFRTLTLHAIRNHQCTGPDDGNWQAVGEVILARIWELAQHDIDKLARFYQAAHEYVPPGSEDDGTPSVPARTRMVVSLLGGIDGTTT